MFLTKVDSKWSLKHKGRRNEAWCNGAYVNRKFIIASKFCIEKIQTYYFSTDLLVFNHYECNHKNESGKRILKVHKWEDWALLEMPKALFKNYPVCLPDYKTWFSDQPIMENLQFGQVFSMISCHVKDAFVKLDKNSTLDIGCQKITPKNRRSE